MSAMLGCQVVLLFKSESKRSHSFLLAKVQWAGKVSIQCNLNSLKLLHCQRLLQQSPATLLDSAAACLSEWPAEFAWQMLPISDPIAHNQAELEKEALGWSRLFSFSTRALAYRSLSWQRHALCTFTNSINVQQLGLARACGLEFACMLLHQWQV